MLWVFSLHNVWSEPALAWAGACVRERVFTVSQGPALTPHSAHWHHWVSQQILPGPGPRTARFPGLWLVPDLTTLGPHWSMSAHPLLTNNMSYVTLTTVMTQKPHATLSFSWVNSTRDIKWLTFSGINYCKTTLLLWNHRMDWCRLDWVLQWDRSGYQWHTQGGGYS